MVVWIITTVLCVVVFFFMWTYIHEYSHLLAVRFTVGEEWHEINIVPKIEGTAIRWGYIRYMTKRTPTNSDDFVISLAPRFPNLIALGLLPWATYLPGLLGWVVSLFLLTGLVDFYSGSMGFHEESDLKIAVGHNKRWLWAFRFVGVGLALSSLMLWFELGGRSFIPF